MSNSLSDWYDYFAGKHNAKYDPNADVVTNAGRTVYNAVPNGLHALMNQLQSGAAVSNAPQAVSYSAYQKIRGSLSPSVRSYMDKVFSNQAFMRQAAIGLSGGDPLDPMSTARNTYANAQYAVTHPGEMIVEHPVETALTVRGVAGGIRSLSGRGAAALEDFSQRTPSVSSMHAAQTGAKVLKGVSKASGATQSVLSPEAHAIRIIKGAPQPTIFSSGDDSTSLTPQAEAALQNSGLTDEQVARIRADPTVLRKWQQLARGDMDTSTGKSRRGMGVNSASLRQAVLEHSGVDPKNVSFSAATGLPPKDPATAERMNAAAKADVGTTLAQSDPPPAAPAPQAVDIDGAPVTKNAKGVWERTDGRAPTFSSAMLEKMSAQQAPGASIDANTGKVSRPPHADIANDILDGSAPTSFDAPSSGWLASKVGSTAKRLLDLGGSGAGGYFGFHFGEPGAIAGMGVGRMVAGGISRGVDRIASGFNGESSAAAEARGAPPVSLYSPEDIATHRGNIDLGTASTTPGWVQSLLSNKSPEPDRNADEATEGDTGFTIDPHGNVVPYTPTSAPEGEPASAQNTVVPASDVPVDDLNRRSGGRVAYKKGGKVSQNIEPLVQDLMSRYKHAKKAETATTKPLLQHHDKAIVKALNIAKKAI
jgi:hypothetical protein